MTTINGINFEHGILADREVWSGKKDNYHIGIILKTDTSEPYYYFKVIDSSDRIILNPVSEKYPKVEYTLNDICSQAMKLISQSK